MIVDTLSAVIWIAGFIIAFVIDVFITRKLFSGYAKHLVRSFVFAILAAPLLLGPEGGFLAPFTVGIYFVCREPWTWRYLVVGYGSLGFWFMFVVVFVISNFFDLFRKKKRKKKKQYKNDKLNNIRPLPKK